MISSTIRLVLLLRLVLSFYLTRVSWFVMILSVASPLVAILYNAVSWVDWTAPSVMCLARKAVVRGAHARATDTSVIFGL